MLILKNLPWCHCVQVWLWSFVKEIQRTREQTLEIGTNLLSIVLFLFFKICKITWLALLILLFICLHIHNFKLHESFEVQYNYYHGIEAKLNLLELLIQFSICMFANSYLETSLSLLKFNTIATMAFKEELNCCHVNWWFANELIFLI
jgi:hypothetical protein